MKNNGLFSTIFIQNLKAGVQLDDTAQGRMATLAQTWRTRDEKNSTSLWDTFLKKALSYLEFIPPSSPQDSGIYPLYEDWNFSVCIAVLYLIEPGADIDDTSVGRFYPAKLIAKLRERKLNWGILTDGARWRLYSTKSSRPYEDFVELPLAETLENNDEAEYGLFERFFHKDSFIAEESDTAEKPDTAEKSENGKDAGGKDSGSDETAGVYKCRLDRNRAQSEDVLEKKVKSPFLSQVDEVLQYICNGFIFDTKRSGEEYTKEERDEIFESAVKLIYRCLFLFYAEARRLLPSDPDKADLYRRHSIQALCQEARKFRWGTRRDTEQYDLWQHLKGLVDAVNDGDPEYGIMGYNGGLFDDEEERFLGQHRLRNDFLSRALYLLAFVEPCDNKEEEEYPIPYEDLEVRHLGELYENILEYTVILNDADRIRRRTKKGVEILLASQTTKTTDDRLIRKGEVYFGESALERKQTGSYYTPESLVRFLNEKTIVQPLRDTFERKYRQRFDEFLEQARKGHDAGARRGAAQSAAALVERFVEEEVLNFKVCDPAMGSGHFLVDAANQMAGLVVALIEEVPYIEGMTASITSHPNDWRRRITRNCIYGVDLNPLAVNLAKLSLWLNCFASEHKLTFLDHHVRCGNSLIGIRSLDQLEVIPERKKDREKKKKSQMLLFGYNGLSNRLAKASQGVASMSQIAEDDTDTQKAVFYKALHTTSDLLPLADLYTAYLMDSEISDDGYKVIFEFLAKGEPVSDWLNPSLSEILKDVEDYRNWHHFYHWPMEFPDVFGPGAVGGFSATIGNPPWDIVKPNSQEFFSSYDSKFRSYEKQEANRVSSKLMADNQAIAEKWKRYCDGYAEQSTCFREPLSYSALGKGDINTFKLFLEQFFDVLRNDGRMGIVVPSGIYTDEGCHPLRQCFFKRSRIDFLYCFENRWPTVFTAVDGRFKFVTFGTQKSGETDQFKCAFMEHDPERLPAIDAKALKMSVEQVKRFSPDTLGVMEFHSQKEIIITEKLFKFPLLSQNKVRDWKVILTREFDTSTDSHLFNTEGKDCALYEGKIISIYDNEFAPLNYWILEDIVRARELRKKWKVLAKEGREPELFNYQCYRCGFRRIAASTNERTCLAMIIPPDTACPDTVVTISRLNYDTSIQKCVESISAKQSLALLSVLNSFTFDFVIRQKITTHLDMHFVYSVPVPEINGRDLIEKKIFICLVARSLRLVCTTNTYVKLWKDIHSTDWQSPTFWYPESTPIDDYGPAPEQEIRRRLRDEAKNLSPDWGPHCGVHDRLPDRRDTGDRAQLRAEIDAYVAHLYGLTRDDFSYILDTFPVLRKKEKKAFGEFMSKRKCLEEYDRIGKILAAGGM